MLLYAEIIAAKISIFSQHWSSSVEDGIKGNRARQLYKNICMLFLFPVKTVSLVQASMQHFDASCYG